MDGEVRPPKKASDYGDIDLVAIFPIFVAACTMLTPLLNWSTGIRQHARTIAVCWGFLMFAALGFTPLKILHGVDPVSDHHQYATCSVDIAKDCKPGKLDENIVILTIDYQNR